MAWVRTDDNAPNHPKMFRAGLLAFGFWLAGNCYCNRNLTDGLIPLADIPLLFPGVSPAKAESCTARLVEAGLWEIAATGYQVHDYHDYQPSSEQVKAEREASRRRQEEMRKRRVSRRDEAVTNAVSHGSVTAPRPVPSRPDPKNLEPTTLSGTPRPTPRVKVATPASQPGHDGEARAILAFLNDKTGRSYRPVPANLTLIEARLASGATPDNIRGVIARKVREWNGDPKMRSYLRPATLFNLTKFEQYLGEKPAPAWGEKPHV